MSKGSDAEVTFEEGVDLQEIDERHYVAVNLFERRRERGWSQERLAEEAAMTQAQIARLEAGQANPTLRTLTKLAYTLGEAVYALATPPELGIDFGAAWDIGAEASEGVFGDALTMRATERPFTGGLVWAGAGRVAVATGEAKLEARRAQRQPAGAAA